MLEENATPIYDMLVDRCCRNAEAVEAWRRETYDTDIPVMCHLEGGDTRGEPVHIALGNTPTEEWEEWLPPGKPWPRTDSRDSVVDPVGGCDGELSYEEELLLARQECDKWCKRWDERFAQLDARRDQQRTEVATGGRLVYTAEPVPPPPEGTKDKKKYPEQSRERTVC